jgi:hypothetical protein
MARPSPDVVAKLPDFVAPELATLVAKAPAGDDWLHEIKLDGYRAMARIGDGKVRMLTRRGLDWTARFQPIADALAKLKASNAYIDGEVVVLDEAGVSAAPRPRRDMSNLPPLHPGRLARCGSVASIVTAVPVKFSLVKDFGA